MDALEKGKAAASTGYGGKVADIMVHASQFVHKKDGTPKMDAPSPAPFHEPDVDFLGGGEGVSFKLLKRGHKGRVEAKYFMVPKENKLSMQASKQDDEASRKRDMLKARVLQYEVESAEHQYLGGNVYMDQAKLQVIRNRPLSMEDIDRNFGSGATFVVVASFSNANLCKK